MMSMGGHIGYIINDGRDEFTHTQQAEGDATYPLEDGGTD
jgi:hypothetical protein